MRKLNLLASVVVVLVVSSVVIIAQNRSFVPVEGANLQAKIDAAVRQARTAAPTQRFWTAYSFDVRPGVAIDFEMVGDNGVFVLNGNIHFDEINMFGGDAVSSIGSTFETRNLGVFLLRESERVVRVEVFNLERRREYSGYPVYWLGRAANEESLTLLRSLVDGSQWSELARDTTRAIALHDDRRTGDILENIARTSNVENVRTQAIQWLGHTQLSPARQAFLADLVRNESESQEVRRYAISAYGRSRDASTLPTLISLYGTITARNLKENILRATARNNNTRDASNFLIKVASTDGGDLSKKAISYLGDKASEHALGARADASGAADAETEVQKQAVVALSRRPKDEAVPLLINLARTHRKPEVRKQAFQQLGRTGDPRALEFFKEILSK
ncbi:MAG TPA: HEAT repeat domain-containing protein [Pyrinomonadaceae bacterium]